MKVLVTGGSGFLGSHVADALTEAGHAVTVFDLNASPYLQPSQRMVVGSILDEDAVRQATEGQEAILHFAGMADLDDARSRASESVRQNVLGTINLLEAGREAGITRFVHASTIYVYSERGGFYRCSKQAAELYVEEFQRRYGIDFTILRFGTLYGPRADERNSVYRLLQQALRDKRLSCDGTGDEMRDYVNVRDAARLTAQVLDPQHRNHHVIITGPYPLRYRQLVEMIAEIMGGDVPISFDESDRPAHYKLTPVTFSPKIGYKLTSDMHLDMAQGLLECLHEMHDHTSHG
ncbi:MAG: NAD(P)-dependent oxidoreductase [Acidimicrobiia bacterium]|nr:NAD(P)-dependent oxidoreductase [Acidimicrobiia bacterium]